MNTLVQWWGVGKDKVREGREKFSALYMHFSSLTMNV